MAVFFFGGIIYDVNLIPYAWWWAVAYPKKLNSVFKFNYIEFCKYQRTAIAIAAKISPILA